MELTPVEGMPAVRLIRLQRLVRVSLREHGSKQTIEAERFTPDMRPLRLGHGTDCELATPTCVALGLPSFALLTHERVNYVLHFPETATGNVFVRGWHGALTLDDLKTNGLAQARTGRFWAFQLPQPLEAHLRLDKLALRIRYDVRPLAHPPPLPTRRPPPAKR